MMSDHMYSAAIQNMNVNGTTASSEDKMLLNVMNQSGIIGDLINTSYQLIEPSETETYEIHTIPDSEELSNIVVVSSSENIDQATVSDMNFNEEILEPEEIEDTSFITEEISDVDEKEEMKDNSDEVETVIASTSTKKTTKSSADTLKPLICVLCKDEFLNFTKFRDHLFDSHIGNNGLYKCKKCDKSYDLLSELKKHDSFHTGIKPFVCEYCNKGFLKKNVYEGHLLLHIHKDEEFPFMCAYCDKHFRLKEMATIHILKHQAENVTHFECDNCSMAFYSELSMAHHQNKIGSCNADLKNKSYQCQICSLVFEKRLFYILHFKENHPDDMFLRILENNVCIKCGEIVLEDGLEKHAKLHKAKDNFRMKCRVCSRVLKGKGAYTVHMKMHLHHQRKAANDDEEMPTTKENEEDFTSNTKPKSVSSIIDHSRKQYDMTIVDFQCENCSFKSVMSKLAIEKHTNSHMAGPPYLCDRCLQNFPNPYDWVDHLHLCFATRMQGGLPCPACPTEVDTTRGLKTHIRVMHKEHLTHQMRVDNVNYLKCPICHKNFLSRQSLAYHKTQHKKQKIQRTKEVQCPFCPSKFSSTVTLMVHKRSHTGEKPFQCKNCPKAFKCRTALRNHCIIHTRLYRHFCDTCHKGFVTPYKMKQHQIRTHLRGIKPPKPKTPRAKRVTQPIAEEEDAEGEYY